MDMVRARHGSAWKMVPLLAILALTGVACLGGRSPEPGAAGVEEAGDDGGTASDPAGAAAPEEAGDGTKVVPFLTAESSPESVEYLTGAIADFEAENPGVAIELQLMSNDARIARIINAVSTGEEMGIFEIARDLVPDFTHAGYLLPLDSIVEEVGVENFVPGSLLYWPWDGHIYQFPADVSSSTMYWRKDLFEQAGLGEPASLEDVITASQRLHGQNGVSGNTFEASAASAAQRMGSLLWQHGGDYYTKQGEVAFGSEQARQAVHAFAELNKYAPEGSHAWGAFDPITTYTAGRAAMSLFPGRLGYQLFTDAPDLAEVTGNRIGNVSPGGTATPVVYGAVTTYAIGANVRHEEEAKKFLAFLLTGDRLLQYSMAVPGHILPAQREVQAQQLEQDHPYVNAYGDWVETHFEAAKYFNHESQNMGSITADGEFRRSVVPMPWASRVIGEQPIVAEMMQRISLEGVPVDDAWQQAVEDHEAEAEAWKSENPWWEPPSADWEPPGADS